MLINNKNNMLGTFKMCYTCLETKDDDLIDVTALDFDNINFLYKLQTCVSSHLDEHNSKYLCSECVRQLRLCYKFRSTVLLSQDILYKRKNEGSPSVYERESPDDLYKNVVQRQYFVSQCLVVDDRVDLVSLQETDKEHRELPNNNGMFYLDQAPIDLNDTHNSPLNIGNLLINKLDCVKCEEIETRHQNCSDSNSDETRDVQLKPRGVRAKKKPRQEDLQYECYHCATVFNKRWKLQKHITRVHTNIKKHVCSYCAKSFKQSYHLREHLTSHTGERNYKCSYCEKTFQRISSLKRHIRSHERAPGEKTKKTPFLCTVCGKNFPFSNGVQRHMRIHLGIRNHECNVCQRRFTQSTHLHVHMRTHTGEKPYICDTCGEAFPLNASLQKHMTIHKSNESDDLPPLKMSPISN